ncbi:helicase-exonuclease AddAB subunit AddB [Paenibacillus sp. JX-17]|uniref:ATP-dependent helicase/deoxyribonuclease subunit B n=1 Tax=Paenibacillus lacisoli TaxID=3064525 RepID=A0ABT9C9Z8_9BACL|nr:helicase-exonuclease AddAB subunit AddB [Paenibacillus sp. JX-17]MDO7905469.1 helicase-exonuclease AddAB subunit AddB [Paenibacillus sp. JX-17]
MSVTFLLGRAGSGKSTKIMEEMTASLRDQPQGTPMMLLVPEQATFQAEHSLVSSGTVKGSVRAQVLSFRRLAYRVMQETGGAALTPISEEGKKMLLYRIIRRRKEELKLFGDSGDQLGFVGRLNDLYTEFKRYCVEPMQLEEQMDRMQAAAGSAPMLRNKLQDIMTIHHDFEHELSRLYVDEEDTLARLEEAIPRSSYTSSCDIWLDGFRGFTPQELQVLERLMAASRSMTIALTLDREYSPGELPHELDLFHPTASTFVQLRGMAESLGLDIQIRWMNERPLPRFRNSPQLAHLEEGFDRRRRWDRLNQAAEAPLLSRESDIRLIAASNRRAEVEGALREMLRLAREEGARFRDMAILVRNLEDYAPLVEPVFRDFDIPYFLDQKRSELHHPLVELLRASLDIVLRRWRYEDVFRAVKTDILLPLDGSLTRQDMDRLENYVLACGIQGYRWTDGRPWQAVPSLSLEDNGQGLQSSRQELLDKMEACRTAIVTPLYAFEKRLSRAKTAREQCEALYLLLEDCGAAHKLETLAAEAMNQGDPERGREHRQLWGKVLELLDQIAEMMGDEKLEPELFAGMMETGLSELKLSLVPPALDQVLVGTMDRTRTVGVKYAFLLGFNEGVVPAVIQEEGVLTEQERMLLAERGFELAPDITRRTLDERFLVYQALTLASDKLWVSYPAADEDLKPLLPSEYIRHLRQMFALQEEKLSLQPLPGQGWEQHAAYAAHPEEALAQLIVQLRQWKRGIDIPQPWWDVLNWFAGQPEWRGRLERSLGSLFYQNPGEPLRESTSRQLYGSKLRTSVSRMERFVACPFSHFASHGLRLKERQLYRLQAPDIGQLFHAALSQMAMNLKERNLSWGSLSSEECRQEAEQTVDRLAPQLQGEILLSSKRYGYIYRKLKSIVSRASLILGEHARRGSFEPLGLELDFGPDKPLPPLVFELENGCVMEVVGRIDRVDVAEGEQGLLLRVIDYKSSQKDLKLHEVYYGLALQMLTYLEVLLSSAEDWLGEPAFPAGTLYFHVHNPLLQAPNGLSKEKAEEELLKRFKMKGLVLADREVVGQMDTSLDKGYSSVLPVAVKADGSFYSSASVATREQWDQLLASVRSSIRQIGTRITEGDVEIKPYKIQQETACAFCSYKPVCQFDDTIEGNDYNTWSKPGKQQVWELLDSSKGKGGEE